MWRINKCSLPLAAFVVQDLSREQARTLREAGVHRSASTAPPVSATALPIAGQARPFLVRDAVKAAPQNLITRRSQQDALPTSLAGPCMSRFLDEPEAAAEHARQRARERSHKAKEALAEEAAREREEAADKEARKWEARDRKVQRFLARKRAAEMLASAAAARHVGALAQRVPSAASRLDSARGRSRHHSSEAPLQRSLGNAVLELNAAHPVLLAPADATYLNTGLALESLAPAWATSSSSSTQSHAGTYSPAPQPSAPDTAAAPFVMTPGTALMQQVHRRFGESVANTTLDPDMLLDQLRESAVIREPVCSYARDGRKSAVRDGFRAVEMAGGHIVASLLRPAPLPKRVASHKLTANHVDAQCAPCDGPVSALKARPSASGASLIDSPVSLESFIAVDKLSASPTSHDVGIAAVPAESAHSSPAQPLTRDTASGLLSPWFLPSDSVLVPADDGPVGAGEDVLFDEASSSILLLPTDCRNECYPPISYRGPWAVGSGVGEPASEQLSSAGGALRLPRNEPACIVYSEPSSGARWPIVGSAPGCTQICGALHSQLAVGGDSMAHDSGAPVDITYTMLLPADAT